MAISRRLRFEILRRDDHSCRYCGRSAPQVVLNVDHVVPSALGGSDDPSNLVAACADCNSGKSSVPADASLVASVAADAARWALAMKTVAEARQETRTETWSWFNMVWIETAERCGEITDHQPDGPGVAPDWIDSVEQFLAAGLTQADLTQLATVAMCSPAIGLGKWRYFCGCCWRLIRRYQDEARALLSPPEAGLINDQPERLETRWTRAEVDACHAQAADIIERMYPRHGWTLMTCEHAAWEGLCGDPMCTVSTAQFTIGSLTTEESLRDEIEFMRPQADNG